MARVTLIHKPSEYPGTPDEATRQALVELFATLFPGVADPAFDDFHDGMAIAAHNPKLAQHLAKLSGFIAGELPWCQRRDLRELAIQALSLHFKSDYACRSRLHHAEAARIDAAKIAALPYWRTSNLFDAEQRLTIEYSNAVVIGEVPEELVTRVVSQFGEKGAVECTALVAFWSFWAMMLSAMRP